jgi:hypothetical protein
MSSSQDRTVIWVVVAAVLALVCCLCLVLAAAGASVYLSATTVLGPSQSADGRDAGRPG